jgi:hypothetical protein
LEKLGNKVKNLAALPAQSGKNKLSELQIAVKQKGLLRGNGAASNDCLPYEKSLKNLFCADFYSLYLCGLRNCRSTDYFPTIACF